MKAKVKLRPSLRRRVTRHAALTLSQRVERLERDLLFAAKPAQQPAETGQRFTKLDADGKPTTGEHVAVRDSLTGLIWTKDVIGSHNWKDAKQACADCRVAGATDWRLPTVKELLSLVDYGRVNPAVDTNFFAGEFGYTWTSNIDAESPSDVAWLVGLRDGYVDRHYRTLQLLVRAVRAGQQLALLA